MSSGEAISVSASELVLQVLVAPRSSRNALLGFHDSRIKIALTAPPVDGEANEALISFLGQILKAPKSAISITRGSQAKRKEVHIASPSPEALRQRLLELLS